MENTKDQNSIEGLRMRGDWRHQSMQLKLMYAQLTNDDLKFEAGKEDELLQRIEKRLNKGREEVVHIISKVQPATFF